MGPDGLPASTPVLEGVRDGYEDFAYWHTLDVLLDRLDAAGKERSPKEQEMVEAARTFRKNLVAGNPEDSVLPARMAVASPGRGYEAHLSFSGDRWTFREVKGKLLRHVETLEKLLND